MGTFYTNLMLTVIAVGVGDDKGSLARQREVVQEYAAAKGLEIASEHYDAAVSGAAQ